MILDNRVHRTIRLTIDGSGQEFPITSGNPFKVLLKVIDGRDTLVVMDGATVKASLVCTKTFTPPGCPSPVSQIGNPSCQFKIDIEDTLFRIIELEQNLIDPNVGIVMAEVVLRGGARPTISHVLDYQVGGITAKMVDGGLKVPPDLG